MPNWSAGAGIVERARSAAVFRCQPWAAPCRGRGMRAVPLYAFNIGSARPPWCDAGNHDRRDASAMVARRLTRSPSAHRAGGTMVATPHGVGLIRAEDLRCCWITLGHCGGGGYLRDAFEDTVHFDA